MLFSKDFLFIHIPKTGGMSTTRWLLNNYRGEMYLYVQENAFEHARTMLAFDDIEDRLTMIPGHRHATLPEARQKLEDMAMPLDEIGTIFAVARHPLDLERSYYHHLRKPERQARRPRAKKLHDLVNELEFPEFLEQVGFYKKFPANIEEYCTVDGEMPDNFELLRLETLTEDLRRTFAPYFEERYALEHRNSSKNNAEKGASHEVPEEWLDILRRKHPFLCGIYDI